MVSWCNLQAANESLGISVAGGYNSTRGDVPIYITNIQENGCLARTKQVKVSAYVIKVTHQIRQSRCMYCQGHTNQVEVSAHVVSNAQPSRLR